MRVAAIDLGTNTTRLLVADVDGDQVEEVVRRSVITGLGEGVDATRILLPGPVARVHAAIADYRRDADRLAAGPALAVATSAVRDAENRLDPDRAPVIVAGALIVAEVLHRYGLSEIAYGRRDLLDGVALEVARE